MVLHRGWRAALALALAGLLLGCASAPSAAEPTVIVISLDGVRPDYLERAELPALARIAREGARAEAMIPVFPSLTFPNHVSMATGTFADRHGIVANRFHDRERGEFDYENDASWIRAEPLWVAAERQGVTAATFFWVGSETDWQGVGATYRVAPFDGSLPESEKVERILAWLDLPPGERPRLVMSWWHGADSAGHRFGPKAEETLAQLARQDHELGRLVAGLDARGAWDHTTLLVVSDHGMLEATEALNAHAALRARDVRARVDSSGPVVQVFLEDPGQRAAAVEALAALEGVRAWPGDALPQELRFGAPGRTGDVVALADPPRIFLTGRFWRDAQFRLTRLLGRPRGIHGYDPAGVPEMHTIFLARGRGVRRGVSLGRPRAIDVAPTAARLLGIEPPRHSEGDPIF